MTGWDEELAELDRRREAALQMGGPERVARQRAAGRLTVRERLDALVDAGSWREVGVLAGRGEYDGGGALTKFTPTSFITGFARLDGRRVVVCADDFTVRGGAADAAIHDKLLWAERAAGEQRVPLIRLLDGTGGGGSVKSLIDMGRTYLPWNPGWDLVVENLARIPVVSLALGPVVGLGAARLVSSHVSILVRDLAQVFVAGPPIVAAGMREDVDSETLGGWRTASRAGTVDLLAGSEADAFALARQVLGYLPQHAWSLPPRADPAEAAGPAKELRGIVPRDRRAPYDVRRLMQLVFDAGSVLELAREFGRSTVTALARLDGYPVAVLASDPTVYGGGMTADGGDKAARFVDLAGTFHLPVVHLVDQPGFVIGTAAERAGTIRRGARALAAFYQSELPWASVVIRRAFGVAGAAHRPHHRYSFRVAWPSGDWGSLPVEGGLEVAFKRMLADAGADRERLAAELAAKLDAVRSPFRTAEAFLVEDIVDPAETRPRLSEWVADAYAAMAAGPVAPPRVQPRP